MQKYEKKFDRPEGVISIWPTTNEEDPLASLVGKWVAFKENSWSDPLVGKLQKAEDNGYRLPIIGQYVRIPADCPEPDLPGYEVVKGGRSGIARRNDWAVKLPTTLQKVPTLLPSDDPKEWFRYILKEEEIPVPDPAEYEQVQEALLRHRRRFLDRAAVEAAELALGEWDAAILSEFNKTPFFGRAPEGFLAVIVKVTSCSNTRVVLIRDKATIRVPDRIKGLVIGRGGKNVRALEKKAGHRIKVV